MRRLPTTVTSHPVTRRWGVADVLLWLAILVATLSLSGALITGEGVYADPPWVKGLKDVPVALLIGYICIVLGRRLRPHGLRGGAMLVRSVSAPLRALLALTAAMGALMLVSAVFIDAPSAGFLVSVRYYVVYPLVGVGLALVGWGEEQRTRVSILIVVLALVQVPLSALDFAGVFNDEYYAGSIELFGYLYPRAIGTLGNPNNLGIFLALATILVATRAAPMRGYWTRVALVVLLSGLVLTFSKTAAVAFAIAAVGLVLSGMSRRNAIVWIMVSLLAAAAAFSLRIGGTVGNRFDTATEAAALWTSDPGTFLAGVGFSYTADLDEGGRLEEVTIDNMVLALAVEGGLLAVALFAAMVGAALLALWRARERSAFHRAALVFGGVFLIYVPLAVNFRLVPAALLFWMFVGLCSDRPDTSSPSPQHRRAPGRRMATASQTHPT